MADKPITFSITERITLANQFRILTKIDPDYAHHYSLEDKIKILEGGFEGQYGQIYGRFMENHLSPEDCKLVEKTMLLHSWLMDWEGKTNIDVSEFRQVQFDVNNETDHYSFAKFLYERSPEGYQGVIGVVDAHRPTLHRWRRMVKAWEDKQYSTDSEADVSSIITAGTSTTE